MIIGVTGPSLLQPELTRDIRGTATLVRTIIFLEPAERHRVWRLEVEPLSTLHVVEHWPSPAAPMFAPLSSVIVTLLAVLTEIRQTLLYAYRVMKTHNTSGSHAPLVVNLHR